MNGNEDQATEYVQQLFEEQGIESQVIDHGDNRSSLVAEMKGQDDGKVLALSGHFDVVSVDDESAWSYNPFDGTIEDGKMYGRGTADMKAGVAAIVIAMLELKESQTEFNGTIRFIGTAGEEVGMVGSKTLAEDGYADNIDGLILPEPSVAGEIHHAHKGTLNYTITSQGEVSHSSSPQNGINAIDGLLEFMIAIKEEMKKIHDEYENEELGRTLHSFTVINGGNQVNSLPERVTLENNARTIPEFTNEKVIGKIEEVLEQAQKNFEGELAFEVTQSSLPVVTDADSELVQAVTNVLGDQSITGMAAVTDASSFVTSNNDFDLVVYGPGDSNLAHVVDEYVEVDVFLDFIENLKEIVTTYLE